MPCPTPTLTPSPTQTGQTMNPLLPNKIPELLTRIDHAINGELISVVMNNPQNFTIELSVQDKNRGYDWINIAFEIDGIKDAKLLDENKLHLVDMSMGITILHDDATVGIAIGEYRNADTMKDSLLYLIGSSMKYEERAFSVNA